MILNPSVQLINISPKIRKWRVRVVLNHICKPWSLKATTANKIKYLGTAQVYSNVTLILLWVPNP